MLAVARHGDRTPKQKMKMKVVQVGEHRAVLCCVTGDNLCALLCSSAGDGYVVSSVVL